MFSNIWRTKSRIGPLGGSSFITRILPQRKLQSTSRNRALWAMPWSELAHRQSVILATAGSKAAEMRQAQLVLALLSESTEVDQAINPLRACSLLALLFKPGEEVEDEKPLVRLRSQRASEPQSFRFIGL